MSDERRVETLTGYGEQARSGGMRAAAVAAFLFWSPAIATAAAQASKEVRTPRVDRLAIENLQRWVNGGHDSWCKDSAAVAAVELRRLAPEFSGNRRDLLALPAPSASKSGSEARFTWVSIDGSATYRITVRRFDWLKPVAGKVSNEVWIPSRIEVTRAPAPKRKLPELPRA